MLNFSQHEVEGRLQQHFPYGTAERLSVLTGRNPSQLIQELNPNSDRESPSYRFLQIQCALDAHDLKLGQAHWLQIIEFRETSLPDEAKQYDLDTASLRNHKESFDVAQARMAGKSLYDQLKEVLEQEAAVAGNKQAILQAIHAEQSNGGSTRFSSRDFAKTVVEGRK
jgi:hypothetical protein